MPRADVAALRPLCAAFALALGGCASTGPGSVESALVPYVSEQEVSAVRVHPTPAADIDGDPLFKMLIAEFAGQREQLAVALTEDRPPEQRPERRQEHDREHVADEGVRHVGEGAPEVDLDRREGGRGGAERRAGEGLRTEHRPAA